MPSFPSKKQEIGMSGRLFGVGRVVLMGIVVVGIAAPSVATAQRVRDGRNRSFADDWSDGSDRGPKDTEHVDRTIQVPANGTLRLKNFSGDIHIVATSGRDIVMKATRRATRERLDHVKLDVSTSGSTVTIEANRRDAQWERDHKNNSVVDTEFELDVPTSINLAVEVFSSDVTIDGVTGDQKLHSFSGRLDVLNPRGPIDAETFNGDIRMTISRDARGSIAFDTFSGDVDTDLAISSTSWRKRSIEGTLPGGSGPRMKFHTFSGDLKISSR
jgi:hypothetical protein